jgi:hypothetical protein
VSYPNVLYDFYLVERAELHIAFEWFCMLACEGDRGVQL